MSKQRKIIIILLVLVFVGCLGYIGYYYYQNYIIPQQEDDKNSELREEYTIDDSSQSPSEKISFEVNEFGILERKEDSSREEQDSKPISSSSVADTSIESLDKVKQHNHNVQAWIFVKDTTINYPVVQNKNNNSYYLNVDVNGYYSINGSIYLDKSVDLKKSQNIVVYGHRMDAALMFHDLEKFKDEQFGKSHDVYFDIGDKGSKYWEVAGVFYCPEYEGRQFTNTTFNKDSIKTFIQQLNNKSLYKTDAEPSETDQFLTLITCSYEGQNYRTVVVCRRKQ